MRSRGLVVDIVLGLLLGWAGWASAHLAWDRPPRMGRRAPWEHDESDLQPVPDISPAVDVFLVLLVVGVAVRRRWPRAGFVLVLAGLAGYRALGAPAGPVYIALALGVFAMATALPLRRWVPLTAGCWSMMLAGHWREPYLGLLDPDPVRRTAGRRLDRHPAGHVRAAAPGPAGERAAGPRAGPAPVRRTRSGCGSPARCTTWSVTACR